MENEKSVKQFVGFATVKNINNKEFYDAVVFPNATTNIVEYGINDAVANPQGNIILGMEKLDSPRTYKIKETGEVKEFSYTHAIFLKNEGQSSVIDLVVAKDAMLGKVFRNAIDLSIGARSEESIKNGKTDAEFFVSHNPYRLLKENTPAGENVNPEELKNNSTPLGRGHVSKAHEKKNENNSGVVANSTPSKVVNAESTKKKGLSM